VGIRFGHISSLCHIQIAFKDAVFVPLSEPYAKSQNMGLKLCSEITRWGEFPQIGTGKEVDGF
jgi:hypothetical protein